MDFDVMMKIDTILKKCIHSNQPDEKYFDCMTFKVFIPWTFLVGKMSEMMLPSPRSHDLVPIFKVAALVSLSLNI